VRQTLDDNKAEDIVVIDLHGKSSIADSMIIATGRSQRHLASLAEHLAVLLKEQGIGDVGVEGASVGDWVLVDGGDVIVHLFREEVRRHYSLEKMWGHRENARWRWPRPAPLPRRRFDSAGASDPAGGVRQCRYAAP
jgi:ribosome-associated protein